MITKQLREKFSELAQKTSNPHEFRLFCEGYQLGCQHQRDADAALCEKSDRYRGDYFAEKIRANTGELK